MNFFTTYLRNCVIILALLSTVVFANISFGARANVEAFVTRFYNLCLNRDPDSAGLKGWVDGLLDQSLAGSDVAYGFVFSQEFIDSNVSNEEYLAILYQAFFSRRPDSEGWQGWLEAMNSGTSRRDVLDGFVFAAEFNELCRLYGIMPNPVATFVARFYTLFLKRDADNLGLDGWVSFLLSGERVGADLAQGFIFSQEFPHDLISDEEYVTILYRAFFNREPDASGMMGWLKELELGKDRREILDGFIYSTEFVKLCLNYGIKAFHDPDYDFDGDGYTENQGDCNEVDPATNPGAKDICWDGIDQDCDGYDAICVFGNWIGDGISFNLITGRKIWKFVYYYDGTSDCSKCRVTIDQIITNSGTFSYSNNSIGVKLTGFLSDATHMSAKLTVTSPECPLADLTITAIMDTRF